MTTQPPDLKKLREAKPTAWLVVDDSIKYHASFRYELHARNTAQNMAEDGYEPILTPVYEIGMDDLKTLLDAYEDKTERLCIVEQSFKAMQSKIDSLKDAYEASARDAERWRAARDNTGDGIRIITWDHKADEEIQVMFPSPILCDEYADAARHATQGD